MDLTPKEYYVKQLRNQRQWERRWEHTREILAFIASSNSKKSISGKQIIELSIDEKTEEKVFGKELSDKIMKKLN